MRKTNTTDDLLKLEKVVRKVIIKAFKDRTLDYTVQFSVSSLEPKKVKYAFMINGTKKEIRVEPQAFDNFETALKVAEGMLTEVDAVALEKTFHESRINTFKTAIKQHEDRIKVLDNPPEDDDPFQQIPVEEV
jgi:hypothetical protein